MTQASISQRSAAARGAPWPPCVFDARQRLAGVAAHLSRTCAIARALAQGGRRLDLTGIDDGVGMLCAKTLDLPDEEARAMLPVLLDVLGQVEALQAVLRPPADPAC